MGVQWCDCRRLSSTIITNSNTDVTQIPINGTWFQLIANGTTSINNGTNGLPRLDRVVQLAEQHGIYLMISLTNNWNPLPLIDSLTTAVPNVTRRDVTKGTNNTLNRNYLSNDYGQCDTSIYIVPSLIDVCRRNGCLCTRIRAEQITRRILYQQHDHLNFPKLYDKYHHALY
jgi:hypothetical protein